METRNVILCTLVGASSRQLRGIEFDLVIIDEAAQALEVACWIPMLHTSKVILYLFIYYLIEIILIEKIRLYLLVIIVNFHQQLNQLKQNV